MTAFKIGTLDDFQSLEGIVAPALRRYARTSRSADVSLETRQHFNLRKVDAELVEQIRRIQSLLLEVSWGITVA